MGSPLNLYLKRFFQNCVKMPVLKRGTRRNASGLQLFNVLMTQGWKHVI